MNGAVVEAIDDPDEAAYFLYVQAVADWLDENRSLVTAMVMSVEDGEPLTDDETSVLTEAGLVSGGKMTVLGRDAFIALEQGVTA